MKQKAPKKWPGILITVLFAVALALFMGILSGTMLIPGKYLLVLGGILLLPVLCVFFLCWDTRRLGRMIVALLLMLLVLALLLVGTLYLVRAVDTLDDITQVEVESADVGIYVRAEDGAQSITSVKGYQFGILSSLDRENTDAAIVEIQKELGENLTVQEYEGLAELIDGILTTRQTDAIIINSAYLDLLEEMEGYENAYSQLREVHVQKVETAIIPDETLPLDYKPEEQDLLAVPIVPESNAFTMYISGIDSRSGLIKKSRSDVNILAVVNPDTHQILLVSTPRDFYVPLPNSKGAPDKLTHAGIYGIKTSIGALEMLYDTEIDYYFRVNFSGFEKIIDALGGITVYSEHSFSSGGFSYKEGNNKMNGEKALNFARDRYSFVSGDRQRGKNQMEVIKGVIKKALSPALLKNYTKIMDSVSGSFETSMPYDILAELVRDQLDKGGEWEITSYSVNGTGATKKPYSLSTKAYVMVPDQDTVDTAKEMIQNVIDGEAP